MSSDLLKRPGWLNRKELAETFDVAVVTIDAWKIPVTGIIGRLKYYTAADVLKVQKEIWSTHQRDKLERGLRQEIKKELLIEMSGPACLDLDDAKLKKINAETRKLNLQNNVLEGLSIPDSIVLSLLSEIMSRVGSLLDSLHPDLKRNNPELSAAINEDIERTIINCQNEISGIDEKLEELIDNVVKNAEAKIN